MQQVWKHEVVGGSWWKMRALKCGLETRLPFTAEGQSGDSYRLRNKNPRMHACRKSR